MDVLIWILVFIATFCFMEFMAWFTHKYIMHGFLWSLHKDHHHKNHNSWWERNDLFFVFYAVVSMTSIWFHDPVSFWAGEAIGFGILAYGIAYFLVHDIFIHQRFKIFRKANHWYAKGVRRAHKIHHKHLDKNKGKCFGMLFVPFKYFRS
ncbi:beta-carotene hydroxylase [Aquimarina sp. BL5]|uniref:sterol desaturase family protein n=1 Tax=Aquimarina sp. BL5 TaxID=1714860 RepID=UPI000E537AEB|nr:sterol desaturase family protein [Aquimarina sp. BL5]AXT53441.1 beta-carotene hydroxylase [Aquimarina sp. BL5]RKN08855.1 beta-carotene hydroxylase [Aquimarina sp. BL5]